MLGTAIAGVLCWGSWRAGYDPGWPARGRGFWAAMLQPGREWALPVMVGMWLAVLAVYWWPRRYERPPAGLIAVAVMVILAVVLGTASFIPCRGGLSAATVVFWVLQLFVGQPAPVYPGATVCTGAAPPALQVAQVLGLTATLTGAVTAGSALWRPPLDRLRSRLTRDAVLFTGLDTLTLPLLRRLAEVARSPRRVIVIEPDLAHPLLDDARRTGARIVIGEPASAALLGPVIAGWRGPALSHLYALRGDEENEAIVRAAREALWRYRALPGRHPRLIVRIDDALNASYWRAARNQPGARVIEDALSLDESTARVLVAKIAGVRPRHVLLCGGGRLSLALLLELARQAWEQAELAAAAAAGQQSMPGDGESGAIAASPVSLPAVLPAESVTLLDPRSADLRRDYLQVAPPAFADRAPTVAAHAERWQDHLLRELDAMPGPVASQAAVVIADTISAAEMHEVERIARLHPGASIFIQLPSVSSTTAAAFYGLHPFAPGLLVDGEVPEDTWTRLARHWHDCYWLSNPVPPGVPAFDGRVPWTDLDPFLREDDLQELRSIMSAVAGLGRLWVPVQIVPAGSIIELNRQEAEKVNEAEHTRWLGRQRAAGRTSEFAVPWTDLPAAQRASAADYLLTQIRQLEDIGFVPIVPVGGPPEAITVEHTGTVLAAKIAEDGPQGPAEGDGGVWRVVCDDGETVLMTGADFLASHELADDGHWHRTGTFRAWQLTDQTIIRTRQGRAVAAPRDWVLESADGARWPVSDQHFHHRYQPRE